MDDKKYDITKNFTKKYSEYFNQNKKLVKEKVYQNIDNLMSSFYQKEINSLINDLDLTISHFINLIQKKFPDYNVSPIGSVELKVVKSLPLRSLTLDLLLMPRNQSYMEVNLIEEILNLSNDDYNISYLDKYKNENNTEYVLLLSLNKIDRIFSVKIIQNLDYFSISHQFLSSIFKQDIFKFLHVFIQEIFIEFYKISWTRFNISCLILSFLLFKFTDTERKQIKRTINQITGGKRLGKKLFKSEEVNIFWFEFNEINLNSFKSSASLLFEFLDFIKRFLTYYKIIVAKMINNKLELNFKAIEEEYLNFFHKKILEDQLYMFNLNFLINKIKDKQLVNFYQPKGEQISKLLFGLIENSQNLSFYNNVIEITKLIIK